MRAVALRSLGLGFALCAIVLAAPVLSADPATTAVVPNLTPTELRRATVPGGALAGAAAEYVADDGQVYLLGGYRPATYTCGGSTCQTRQLTSSVYRYDPGLDQFTEAAPLPFPLALAAHVFVPEEQKIYLFGGLRHPGVQTHCGAACDVSDDVVTYDVVTGATQVLTDAAAQIPGARARAAAVLHSPTNTVYLVGGVTGSAAFSPAVASTQLLARFDLGSRTFTGTRALPASGIFTGAVFVPHTYKQTDFSYVEPGANDRGYLLFVGTQGSVEFYPSRTAPFNPFGFAQPRNDTSVYYVGGATVFVPTKDEGWSAGGYCNGTTSAHCDEATSGRMRHSRFVTNLNGAGDGRGIPRGRTDNSPTLVEDSLNDGAAAYVPSLDRVFVFGGFMGTGDDVKGGVADVWDDAPVGDQYRDDVVSASPTHYAETGYIAPVPVQSPALVAGQQKSVVVHRDDPAQNFAIGIQTSFRPAGGTDEVALRILPATQSGTDDVTATFTVPRDLAPGLDERAVGLCAIPLGDHSLPNCREVSLTTNPGFLDIGLTGTPEAGGATAPLTRATVQILDEDGGVVQEQALSGSQSSFTSEGLASGVYTINTWREFVEGDSLVYKPKSTLARVSVGQHTDLTVNLVGSEQIGPVAKSVVASFDQLAGPDIGSFMSFRRSSGSFLISRSRLPDVLNVFSIDGFVEPLAHENYHTARVEFAINGQTFSDSNGSDGWAVPIDMTDVLLPGDNVLRVTAFDNFSPSNRGPTLEFRIKAVASKPLDETLNPDVEFDPDAEIYTSRFVIPGSPRLRYPNNPPAETDLVFFKLYSQARADIQLNERFSLDGSWQATGDAAALLQILSWKRNQYNFAFPFTVTPTYGADGSPASYTISTGRIDLERQLAGLEGTVRRMTQLTDDPYYAQILDRIPIDQWLPIFGGPVYTLRNLARVKLSFDVKYGASVVVEGTIKAQDWSVQEIRVIPRPEVLQRALFELDLFSGLASGGVRGDSSLTYDQPVVYEPGHNPVVYLDRPCVRMLMTGDAWVSLAGNKWSFGNVTFFNKDIPNGCFAQQSRPSARADAAAPPPDVMAQPAIATGPGANPHAMRLWIEDLAGRNGRTDAVLRYSYDGGAAAAVYAPGQQTDPQVAFVGPDQAVATWTQTNVTPTQARSLTPLQILRKQEIMAAVWDGDSWSPPVSLTSNGIGDGRSVVGGDPATGRAVAAWVRDPDGKPITKGDWLIVSRTLDPSSGQWGAETLTGANDGAADFEPTVGFDTAGAKAWLVWIRDGDASPLTNADRRASFRTWDGTGWSGAQRPAAWPAGALHPDLAFSPQSPRPLISLMSSTTTESPSGQTAPAGIGTQNLLYGIWGAPSIPGWDVQQIGDPKDGPQDDVRGEWPEASFLPGSDRIGVIAFRDFGGAGTRPSSGQAALAEGELGATGARWGPVGTLTRPSDMVWQLAASGGGAQSATDLSLMGVVSAPPTGRTRRVALTKLGDASRVVSTEASGSVFALEQNTTGTDLEILKLAVSDPAPAPGTRVTVRATVRNPDLQPMSKAAAPGEPSFEVDLYLENQGGLFELIDYRRYEGELLFAETTTLEWEYIASGRPERLRAELRFLQDLGSENNVATIEVGGALPRVAGAQASRVPWGPVVVEWGSVSDSGPTVYYRVSRAPAAGGPWRPIGVTTETSFTDVAPTLAGLYRVEGIDVLGRIAPASTGVVPQKVSAQVTVRGVRSASRVTVSGTVTPAAADKAVRVELFVKRNGRFVRVGSEEADLGPGEDPNRDGIRSSEYQARFPRPAGGGKCRAEASFGGSPTSTAARATRTFSC